MEIGSCPSIQSISIHAIPDSMLSKSIQERRCRRRGVGNLVRKSFPNLGLPSSLAKSQSGRRREPTFFLTAPGMAQYLPPCPALRLVLQTNRLAPRRNSRIGAAVRGPGSASAGGATETSSPQFSMISLTAGGCARRKEWARWGLGRSGVFEPHVRWR